MVFNLQTFIGIISLFTYSIQSIAPLNSISIKPSSLTLINQASPLNPNSVNYFLDSKIGGGKLIILYSKFWKIELRLDITENWDTILLNMATHEDTQLDENLFLQIFEIAPSLVLKYKGNVAISSILNQYTNPKQSVNYTEITNRFSGAKILSADPIIIYYNFCKLI